MYIAKTEPVASVKDGKTPVSNRVQKKTLDDDKPNSFLHIKIIVCRIYQNVKKISSNLSLGSKMISIRRWRYLISSLCRCRDITVDFAALSVTRRHSDYRQFVLEYDS